MPLQLPSITTDEELQREIRRLGTLTALPEAIHYIGATGEPAFENSWVNFTAGTPSPANRSAGFYKDRGRIYVQGVIKSGASFTTAFTLPVGYRPAEDTSLVIHASGGIAGLFINSTGIVQPFNVGATAVATSAEFYGGSFRAA